MVPIAADGQVGNQPGQGFQAGSGILSGGCPVGIRHQADRVSQRGGLPDSLEKHSIIEKWFTAFEVDRGNAGYGLRLAQDPADLRQAQGSSLPGTAPYKTMIAFERALVSQQQVQPGRFHQKPPFHGFQGPPGALY